MRWEVSLARQGLGEHAATWDTLNAQLCAGEPLLTSRFVNALLREAPPGAVHLCVGLDEQLQARALCLLLQQRDGHWVTFLPHGAPLGPVLLPAAADLRGLLRALPGRASQLELQGLDTSCTAQALWAQPMVTVVSHALAATVDLRGTFEAWWEARPVALREALATGRADTKAKRLAVHTDPTAIAAAVRRAHSLGAWPGLESLYSELMATSAPSAGARLLEHWLGDTLVASQPLLAENGRVVALESWSAAAQAPGSVVELLLRDTVEFAFQTWPGWRLEFHGSAARKQVIWATELRHIQTLIVQRSPDGLLAQARSWVLPGTGRAASGRGPVVAVHDNLQTLPDDVEALFAVGEARRISLGTDWLRLLANTALQPLAQPRVYVLRVDGRPVAALPTLEYPGTGRLEGLSNYYTAMFGPVFEPGLDNASLVPLVRALLDRPDAPATLLFGPMDPLGPGFAMLRESLRRAGLATFRYFAHGNWYLPVMSDWQSYFEARPGAVRSTIKRMGRKFEAAGGRLEIVRTPEDAEAGIRAYEHVYARSWKQAEPHPAFMPGLIRLCARRGWLRLGIAWVGDVPVAAQLWIVANGRAEIYKLAYDEAHKALAPGTLLTTMLMRHAFEVDHVREADYLIGDDPYKAQWMTHRREHLGLVAYNLRSVRGLVLAAREFGGRLMKRLRKEPAAA